MKTSARADNADIVRTAHDWVVLIHSDAKTDIDGQAFERWIHADVRHEEAYDQALTYWVSYDYLKVGDIDPDLMDPLPVERFSAVLDTARQRFSLTQARLAVAAVVLALVAAPVLYLWMVGQAQTPGTAETVTVATYGTVTGETRVMTLGDGTVATMGAATEVETAMSDTVRTLSLKSGAALFHVAPDQTRPFTVKTGHLTVTALGTVFDVRNNGGVARVAVSEGKVAVAHPLLLNGQPSSMQRRVILTAGQQVSATEERGLRRVTAIDTDKVAAWVQDDLVYNGGTLKELVADANRYHGSRIVLDGEAASLAEETITASFHASDMDGMLEMVAVLFPVVVERDTDDRIIIRLDPMRKQ